MTVVVATMAMVVDKLVVIITVIVGLKLLMDGQWSWLDIVRSPVC